MKLFKRRFKNINYFFYKTGSALFRMYSSYEVDFKKKSLSYSKEKYGEITMQKNVLLDSQFIDELKEKIFLTEFYEMEENYYNPLVKDGHQWQLKIGYNNKIKTIKGSNKTPDNFSKIKEIILLLDKKINA